MTKFKEWNFAQLREWGGNIIPADEWIKEPSIFNYDQYKEIYFDGIDEALTTVLFVSDNN